MEHEKLRSKLKEIHQHGVDDKSFQEIWVEETLELLNKNNDNV